MKEDILSHLSPQYPWGDQLHYYEEIGSTNDTLKAMARNGVPHGTAVIAGFQTNGHGRMGRTFLSPKNAGVYLSILLRPDCPPSQLMHLTCATAVAMCDALETAAGVKPQIKWTNDLVFGKRKLGGILTELGLTAQGGVSYAIIGIGINCCQRESDFDPSIQDMAASLSMATGGSIPRAKVAAAMLDALHQMDLRLLTGKAEMLETYRKKCVTVGQDVSLLRGDEVRHGHALDVDEEGALVVLFPDGHREHIASGEVSVRGMYHYV